MSINLGNLIPQMLCAAQAVLLDSWDETKDYAETEFNKFAITLEDISRLTT